MPVRTENREPRTADRELPHRETAMAAKRPKLIDLSLPLESYMMEPQVTEIKYTTHRELAESRARSYKMSADDFPRGMHCATEDVHTTTHSSTHLDAVYHYA